MWSDVVYGSLVVLALFVLGAGLVSLLEKTGPNYVSLACVDAFSRQAFQTDYNVVRVEAWPEAYAITNRNGTLTLVPRSENLVCTLSEEYLPDAQQITTP